MNEDEVLELHKRIEAVGDSESVIAQELNVLVLGPRDPCTKCFRKPSETELRNARRFVSCNFEFNVTTSGFFQNVFYIKMQLIYLRMSTWNRRLSSAIYKNFAFKEPTIHWWRGLWQTTAFRTASSAKSTTLATLSSSECFTRANSSVNAGKVFLEVRKVCLCFKKKSLPPFLKKGCLVTRQ